MEELYETEVWKNLEKNAKFGSVIEDIDAKCLYYADKDHINKVIKDDKLIITYRSKLMNRDLNCQYIRYTKYEVFLDEDSNLIVNEMNGTLRSNYGYDFENTSGGVLDTNYSCEVYDEDGIELAYQAYSDSYDINKPQFSAYKNGLLKVIESAYNPDLASYANSTGSFLCASVLGNSPRFVRQIRSKDNLGIVVNVSCQFDKEGKVVNPKEEYYFNTFLSSKTMVDPEKISFTRSFPFATVDKDNVMHFNKVYTNSGLTQKNYKDVGKARFLRELIEGKEHINKHVPKDVIKKYDLMIQKLDSKNDLSRTL